MKPNTAATRTREVGHNRQVELSARPRHQVLTIDQAKDLLSTFKFRGFKGSSALANAAHVEATMEEEIKNKILTLLDQHRIMTIATLRPDGWPQATTVGYANEGLTIYFACGTDSQKAANLARDDRVSLTIDHDAPQVVEITGLSMAAHARPVVEPAETSKALHMLRLRYPGLPLPMPEDVRIFRVTPTVISVLDYSKGFGHTDLATC